MTSPAPAEQPVKKIVIASDHAGYRYKRRIIEHLTKKGYQVEDIGTDSTESVDYPDFVFPAAKAVAEGTFDRGIVLGGSGNGEAIAANRIKGVRCAVCWNEKSARLARLHNNANMISMGERMVLRSHANRTLPGNAPISGPDMQRADQREQPARRAMIDLDPASKQIAQFVRALIVQPATSHIDGLDLSRRCRANGLVIAFADGEVVLDRLAERGERQGQRTDRRAAPIENIEDKLAPLHPQYQIIGAGLDISEMGRVGLKAVLVGQVVDGDLQFALHIRVISNDPGVVDFDPGDPGVRFAHHRPRQRGSRPPGHVLRDLRHGPAS